jgi:hypothetical protein
MSRPKAEEYTTIKIRTKSLKQLRMLYGLRNMKMIDILDELIEGELERVKNETEPVKE